MSLPKRVAITEVGPRDGLQNEANWVPTDVKIAWIQALIKTGLPAIEMTSFVAKNRIPQLQDAREVANAFKNIKNVRLPVLVPNKIGMEHALESGVREIAVFTTPSEAFSLKNTNCTVEESLNRIKEVIAIAKVANIPVRAYVSCVIACPYSGPTPPKDVLELAKKLLGLGCYEISLGDTTGVGTIATVKKLFDMLCPEIESNSLAVHFHDTYGQALVNIYEALHYGISRIDASNAGLGGCPYAKGASGNVATEDVVYFLEGLHIETGVHLESLIQAGQYISPYLHHETQSKVGQARTHSA